MIRVKSALLAALGIASIPLAARDTEAPAVRVPGVTAPCAPVPTVESRAHRRKRYARARQYA